MGVGTVGVGTAGVGAGGVGTTGVGATGGGGDGTSSTGAAATRSAPQFTQNLVSALIGVPQFTQNPLGLGSFIRRSSHSSLIPATHTQADARLGNALLGAYVVPVFVNFPLPLEYVYVSFSYSLGQQSGSPAAGCGSQIVIPAVAE